jgi:ABC-type transport system substrate-binding protein
MRYKTLFPIMAILLTAMMLLPVNAWIYPDCSEDGLFEMYGPRAQRLLIHLYDDDTAEFAALKAGDIDMSDWPLSKTEYEDMSTNYADVIKITNYGPEFGLFLLDLNSNNNTDLGNPPDPAYPQDPTVWYPGAGNPMADVNLRRAIAYLIDRPGLIADPTIGAGFGFPMYTMMPPGMPKYLLDVYGNTSMAWAWNYDPTAAAALLDANGFAVGGSGYREWKGNVLKLIFYIRSDHPGRNHIGTVLVQEMINLDFYMVVGENVQYATSGTCFVEVMVNKIFHMYTGGWNLGVDPDHLILWSWNYYWHPGFCYDYGGHNDAAYNDYADGIMYANTQGEAVTMALAAQTVQAYEVLGIPLYCASGNKAYYKTNTGTAEPTTGGDWLGVTNMAGYGIDNSWTLMDMHTDEYETDPQMTIDWGYKVPEIKQLNPVYASWLYDWNVLGQLYDSLLVRNASDLGSFLPWTASDYEVGTYTHPTLGECSKIKFRLRSDLNWNDGMNLTVADVFFTFVELKAILSSRGFPNPWWWSNVQDILSFSILDAYTFEVLLGVKSYWALGWIGGNIILPKHIWKPIAETGDPQADQPDTALICSGPWQFVEYNPAGKFVLLEANPWFHRVAPTQATVYLGGASAHAFDVGAGGELEVSIENLNRRVSVEVDVDVDVTGAASGTWSATAHVIAAGGSHYHATGIIIGSAYGKVHVRVTVTTRIQVTNGGVIVTLTFIRVLSLAILCDNHC